MSPRQGTRFDCRCPEKTAETLQQSSLAERIQCRRLSHSQIPSIRTRIQTTSRSPQTRPLGVPLQVIEKLSPLSYRLKLPPGSRIHGVVSIVHLKPCLGDPRIDDGTPSPPPIEIDGVPEYEVERIDGERSNRTIRRNIS